MEAAQRWLISASVSLEAARSRGIRHLLLTFANDRCVLSTAIFETKGELRLRQNLGCRARCHEAAVGLPKGGFTTRTKISWRPVSSRVKVGYRSRVGRATTEVRSEKRWARGAFMSVSPCSNTNARPPERKRPYALETKCAGPFAVHVRHATIVVGLAEAGACSATLHALGCRMSRLYPRSRRTAASAPEAPDERLPVRACVSWWSIRRARKTRRSCRRPPAPDGRG